MKKFFVFAIVLLVHRLRIYGQCKLLLRHPELLQHYKELRRSSGEVASRRTLITKGKGFVCKQCLHLINVDTFQLVEEDEPMYNDYLHGRNDRFTGHHVRDFMRTQPRRLKFVTLPVTGVERGIEVIQCARVANESLYIENGTDDDEYFVFTVEDNQAEPSIQLAIRYPVIVWNIYTSRMNLSHPSTWKTDDYWNVVERETQFLNSQRKSITPVKKEISNVKDINRFKLCSLLYFVWTQSIWPERRTIHSIRRFRNTSKTNVSLLFTNMDSFAGYPIDAYHPVNVIPCAVNTEWDKPSFYVAADPKLNETVNVFSTVEGHSECYAVVMRVNRISLLSHQFWEQFN